MEMVTLYTAALLLLGAFEIAQCQRKVSRNVAVGADVKTVVNFDCPEEFGYYPHPSDCTQYYVCVFGGALLESCTGGLMYSHELQTCDWPRNVGCDGAELSAAVSATSPSPASRTREEPRARYTPPTPPPAQPAAVVTSRGQPRQLHHNQQEIIKQRQQQQLYADAEEALPPAEEVESDRQQRVYRGQPSTVGQVQKDRDGLRHSNAIPSYSGRGERIGVISFGTQQQQYRTTDDDLLTNDLTLKRRRKRQTQRSRHRSSETSWRIGQINTRLHSTPLTLQPPPRPNTGYSQNYQPSNFAPNLYSGDGFKPFLPQYQRHNYPTHTVANKEAFAPLQSSSYSFFSPSTTPSNYQNDYSYFNIGGVATFRPVPTNIPVKTKLREPDKLKHTVEYYRYPSNLMQPQHSHIINQNTSSIKISNPSIKLLSSTTNPTVTTSHQHHSKDKETPNEEYRDNHKNTENDFSSYNSDYFGPPPSYYDAKNKYEHIENPFANPDFDFDRFLDNLRGQKPSERPAKQIPKKTEPNEYYYYYDDEEVDERTQRPKKMYSSQIKPTKAKPNDDYYYEEYDYPETSTIAKDKYYYKNEGQLRPTAANASKTGEVKYSAKYQGKPAKTVKTTKAPTIRTTASQIVASQSFSAPYSTTLSTTTTTLRPTFTSRQKTKTTIPTTRPTRGKNRQRLTDDDAIRPRVEQTSAAPVQAPISTATATARTLYNSSQYNNNNYDPYYALYDDDVELYRDVDYSQQYSNNNAAQSQAPSYRRTPAPSVQSTTAQEEPPKRGNSAYIQNNYNSQDIYQPSTVADYNEDNSYNSQVDDQNSYRQINRQPTRGDRNDLNYIEEATTKRTTTTTTTRKPTTTTTRTTTTSTTTPRTIPPKKSTVQRFPVTANENKTQAQSIINTLREGPGQIPVSSTTLSPQNADPLPDSTTPRPETIPKPLRQTINIAVVNKPAPFTLPEHLTTEKPIVFHYITKSSRSTTLVSTEPPKKTATQDSNNNESRKNRTVIIPTTYSPPKFFLKSLLPKPPSTNPPEISTESKPLKTLKAVRKLISPITVNYGLSSVTGSSFESAEKLVPDIDVKNILPVNNYRRGKPIQVKSHDDESATKAAQITTTQIITTSTSPTTTTVAVEFPQEVDNDDDEDEEVAVKVQSKLRHYVEPYANYNETSEAKRFRTTVEVPPAHELLDDGYRPKVEPDQSPDYKLKPFPKPIVLNTTKTTDSPQNTSNPARVSRVNTAIKSLIAFGGTRRQNVKCHENQNVDSKCHDPKQRTSTRGRGSAHYPSGGNVVNNEVTVTVNRGTPPSRSRPTLKPSTSIVSKASEFIDIYRYPPVRPEPIYPQPQPDKTAAKCRKDVCLLPDCSCGGKEIPGDLPVEQVPQLVLLTYDDSVNDLNKGLYSDLFEKGRVNPNGCPIAATFYVSHEWTDYSQVQNLYSDGHEIASHTVSHSFGEQFSQKKWTREVAGQREILSAYGGVHLEDVRGMRAPFLSVGGNKMFKMLYDSNFTYDSSMPIYENKPPSWPYTLDYKLFHDCMIPPCPTRSYPGVWEVPMVMWQDLNGGRCSMGDACSNPPDAEGVFKMLTKNFQRHYTTNRAPFGLFYHAAWFTQPHHKEGFINFLDSILAMKDVWLVTNWQAIQWIRDPTPTSRLGSFQPFQCDYADRPKRCNNPKVCNLWHKSGVRYMRTCQPCPDIYPWTGNSGIRSSRIDNDIED